MLNDFLHYYKIIKKYDLVHDCNYVFNKVQDCINLLGRKDKLKEFQNTFIKDTYNLIYGGQDD